MKYEVLTIKKHFRHHATVMATPDKWWEKYLLFKRTTTLHFQGTHGLWVDHQFNFAPKRIQELLDAKFDELYPPFSGMGKFLSAVF
jgi:hypothetical protein